MIAEGISKGLAQHALVARVCIWCDFLFQVAYEDATVGCNTCKTEEPDSDDEEVEEGLLWDMHRVLEGSCKLWILKFEDKGGKAVSDI